MLSEELEDVLAEDDGNRLDEAAFAAMDADAASLVRSMFASTPTEETDELEDIAFDEPDPAALREEEIARLAEVLEECRRKQRALEDYLSALGGAVTGPTAEPEAQAPSEARTSRSSSPS